MTDKQKEILRAYAECNMSSIEAGKKLFMCKQNVLYHLKQIHKATGKDPHKFYELLELLICIDGGKSGFAKVVRCRDCKHFTEGMAVGMCKRIPEKPIIPMPYNAFCCFGKRRNDER